MGDGHEREGEGEGTELVAGGGVVKSKGKGERERGPSDPDDSGSDTDGSEVITDDEASSASDYPVGMATNGAGKSGLSRFIDGSGGIVEKISHLDISKGGTLPGVSVHPPSVSILSPEASAAAASSPSIPTIQLPPQEKPPLASSGEESNGGNEPDISASVSEGEGNSFLQSTDITPSPCSEARLLPLPGRRAVPPAGDHGNDPAHLSDSDESENGSSENDVKEEEKDDLEELSCLNRLHRPHRDKGGRDKQDNVQSDSLSITTTTTTVTNTYLYGENASDRVRHLVKRSISKKRKQQKRQSRPKKETKAPSGAGRRSKKVNRSVIKHSVDATIF